MRARPTAAFPWGYQRAISVAYVVAALALFAFGVFILVESTAKLIEGSHPPIGMVEVFDTQIWSGWLMAGIVGIGFGIWWADSVAAIVIAFDIVHEGQKYLRESVADLMDDRPKTHDEGEPHPLLGRINEELRATDWIAEGVVRMREAGHVLTGDIWIVPRDDGALVERVEELTDRLHALDWRIHDVVVSPVRSIEDTPEGMRVS